MIRSEQKKRDEKIIKAYLGGENIRLISAKFGLYPQRIYQILDKAGVKIKKTFDK